VLQVQEPVVLPGPVRHQGGQLVTVAFVRDEQQHGQLVGRGARAARQQHEQRQKRQEPLHGSSGWRRGSFQGVVISSSRPWSAPGVVRPMRTFPSELSHVPYSAQQQRFHMTMNSGCTLNAARESLLPLKSHTSFSIAPTYRSSNTCTVRATFVSVRSPRVTSSSASEYVPR